MPHSARLTLGGGLKLFGQCPYGHNTFQKGASLSNDRNMTLCVDLAVSTAEVTLQWGPNGAWGSEDHPLDPNGDNYIGGVSEYTVSDSLWRVQAEIPWDFLPPNVIRIQVK